MAGASQEEPQSSPGHLTRPLSPARQISSMLDTEEPTNRGTIPTINFPRHLWPGNRGTRQRSTTRCSLVPEEAEDGTREASRAHIPTSVPLEPPSPPRTPHTRSRHSSVLQRNSSTRRRNDALSPSPPPRTSLGNRSRRLSQEREERLSFSRKEFEALLKSHRTEVLEQHADFQRLTGK
jgi:hypothetical protein